MSKQLILDIAERTLWTALQAGVGYLSVIAVGLPPSYGFLVASALAVLKGLIASKVGSSDSASTLPAVPNTVTDAVPNTTGE